MPYVNISCKFCQKSAKIYQKLYFNFTTRYSTDVVMSAAFGIQSNCIENNECRIEEERIHNVNIVWIILFLFVPEIMNFFSISLTNQAVTSYYMNTFRKSVEHRQAHNIVKHDFLNLLIQLMERGYVEHDDKTTINVPCNIHIIFIFNNII